MSRKSNGRTPAAAKRASGAGAKSQAEQTPVSAQRPSSADVVAQSENARSAPTSGSSEANGTGGSASSPAAATEVRVSAAKGRPMLAWVGKRPLSHVKSFPAQLVESFGSVSTTGVGEWWSDWPTQYESPRVSRRLPHLRDWEHDDRKTEIEAVLARGP